MRLLFGAFGCFAFDMFLADVAAAEDEARRVLLHDLVLKPHQAVEQRFGARRTARI